MISADQRAQASSTDTGIYIVLCTQETRLFSWPVLSPYTMNMSTCIVSVSCDFVITVNVIGRLFKFLKLSTHTYRL